MKPLEEMGKFATVVIDPPWPLPKMGGAKAKEFQVSYTTMTIPDLLSLPVAEVLEPDARVFVWTVNRFLDTAFDLLKAWGVDYTYTMTWVKNGGIQTPGSPQFNAEWCLVGKVGHPAFVETKHFFTANYWPRSSHSEKPEGFYDLLRRVTPDPRLDIFGRRRIAGFTSWGNEAPEGEPLPDHYQQVLIG